MNCGRNGLVGQIRSDGLSELLSCCAYRNKSAGSQIGLPLQLLTTCRALKRRFLRTIQIRPRSVDVHVADCTVFVVAVKPRPERAVRTLLVANDRPSNRPDLGSVRASESVRADRIPLRLQAARSSRKHGRVHRSSGPASYLCRPAYRCTLQPEIPRLQTTILVPRRSRKTALLNPSIEIPALPAATSRRYSR